MISSCPKLYRSIVSLGVILLCFSASTLAVAQDKTNEQDKQKQQFRLTKAPKLKKTVEAKYTQKAIDARAEGPVKLRLTIDANGKVTKVEALSGPGYGLNESAAAAAKQFVFEPAEINNVPAAVTLGFTINFTLPILPSKFEGKVIDAKSSKGIKDVKISIEYTGPEKVKDAPKASTKTDDKGAFSFSNVPPGNYKVKLAVDRYRDFTTDTKLVPGKTSSATYKVAAQPVNLIGQVKEAGTRKILPAVEIIVEDKTGKVVRKGFTDAKGQFAFRGLKPATYNVRVKAQGYLSAAFKETVKAKQRSKVLYYVESEYYDEYTVRTRTRRARREVSKQTIRLDEVRRIPGTGGDVVRVIQNLPGVARPRFVSGSIVVRGSAPRDTQTFLEGDNIPLVFHFFGGPAVINSEMIESIDFYPGNFSAKYGRALAGIIDLNTRDPKTDRLHGMLEVDILDATALLEGPITKNLSFAISGRRSYYDYILKPFIPEDTVDVVAAPAYYDYQAWLIYKGFKDSKLKLFVYGSSDSVELFLPSTDPQGNADVQFTGLNLDNSFHRLQLRWSYKPAGPVSNELMISYGQNITGFEAAQNLNFTGTYSQMQLRNELQLQLADNLKARFGADFQYGSVSFAYELPRFTTPGEDSRGADRDGAGGGGRPNFGADGAIGERTTPVLLPAFYAEVDYDVFSSLKIIPGLRVDYYGNVGEASFSPRLVSRWQVAKPFVLKGGIGRFTQPTLPGATDPDFGNADLTYEKSYQYSFGGEWRPLDYLQFDTTLFYRDSFDIVAGTSDFTVDDEGNSRPQIFNNEGEGRAFGAEVLLRHYPNNRFFGWLAYTLSRSERKNIVTGEWQPYQFDQTHILTLVAGYNLPFGIDLSARFRLVSGNPYTPTVGGVYDVEQDGYAPIYGTPYSARNPTFSQLDVRLDKKWIFKTWILGAYLDVLNVTNAENAEGRRYNFDYTEEAPVLGLPIIPTLGINAKF